MLLQLFIRVEIINAQTFLGNYTSHSSAGNVVTVFADTSSLKFIFYKPDIVRVDFSPSPSTLIDSSFIVIQDTIENVNFSIQDYTDRIEISTSSLQINCSKFPLRFSIENSFGELLLSEPSQGGVSSNNLERSANFSMDNNDHFYGTGERGTNLDKRGESFYSFNSQVFGYNSALETMNINVPFFTNKKGYAIYFDNSFPGWFDFGDEHPDKFSYKAFGGELSFYIVVSETIPGQLDKYTWLTGKQPLPPRWAFGYIQSKYGYRNETDARLMVQTMRQKEIPCDAIILDLYWFENMGDISWNFVSWPDPFKMMQDFLSNGIKTIVITEPYIVEYSSNFQTAYYNGYFTFDSQGHPALISGWWSCGGCNAGLLDITNPAAQQWWWNKHPLFFGNELAGIWTDLGEPENHPEQMNHYLGSRDKVHNIFNFLWSQLLYEEINLIRPNRRVFNLTRSGFAGSQRYGIIPWSADVAKDFGGLEVQLPMLLNMGMSGLAYHNSDIGGFCCGTTTPELYARWMQYGTFCPITRAHGLDTQPTEPWGHGEIAEEICKNFISLRYKFLPHIYTMAYENHTAGMPLARPLFFEYPDDEYLTNYSDAYMWGVSILVSPVVVEGQTSKDIYLPEGEWVYFYNDVVFQGKQTVNIETSLDRLPLFIKRGSIIPMQPVMNFSDEFPVDTLMLAIYPSPEYSSSYSLYEDDGISLEYQNGSFAFTNFTQTILSDNELEINIGASTGNFSGKLSDRIILADVHHIGISPTAVLKNGLPLIQRFSYQELRNNSHGYLYDEDKRRLFVQIKVSTDSSYQINAFGIVLKSQPLAEVYPEELILMQNYPNPFNSNTIIKFTIPSVETTRRVVFTTLKVHDVLGNEIAILINEDKPAGEYTAIFDSGNLSSGIYFYTITAGNFKQSKKMLLIK